MPLHVAIAPILWMAGLHESEAVVPARLDFAFVAAAAKVQPEQDWKLRPIPGARMSADLPVEPERATVALRESTRKQVEGSQSGRLTFQGVVFRFAFIEYSGETQVDLDRAIHGALANLKGTKGITELKSKTRELKVSGVPATWLETTYQYMGSPVSFWLLVAGEGERLWQVSAMFRTADSKQESLARRVLESVRLEK